MPCCIRMLVSALVLPLCLTGCPSGPPSTGVGQVVARIDGRDLTVHQLNQLLNSRYVASTSAAIRSQALNALIDQDLLAARAKADGLDRETMVQAAVQAAVNRALAQAQADRIRSRVESPSANDVDTYYDAHPELFRDRRVFGVDELALPGGQADPEGLRDRASRARGIDELAAWLRSKGISAARQYGVIRPEDLSPENASTIQRAEVGGIVALTSASGSTQILRILSATPQPVSRADARTWIERRLLETRQREALNREVALLRSSSKIELLGEFSQQAEFIKPSNYQERAERSVDRGVGALK